jgi:multidrug efflux system outer membrane protein
LQLTQAQTLLTQAQSLVAELAQTRSIQAHALTLLVGTPVNLDDTNGRLRDHAHMPEIRAGLPSDLLASRPDIIAAEHSLRAAHANVEAARAAFFPRIALTTAIGDTSLEFSNLLNGPSKAWIFAPTIDVPIFDGGRRKNNLALEQARQGEALANYSKEIQIAFRDVNDALAARQWLSAQLIVAARALEAQTERARLSLLRFDAGSSAFLEVLDAQRDLLNAEQQAVQVQGALMESKVALFTSLGGGALADEDEADDADNAENNEIDRN